jgi:hypothetical protein
MQPSNMILVHAILVSSLGSAHGHHAVSLEGTLGKDYLWRLKYVVPGNQGVRGSVAAHKRSLGKVHAILCIVCCAIHV